MILSFKKCACFQNLSCIKLIYDCLHLGLFCKTASICIYIYIYIYISSLIHVSLNNMPYLDCTCLFNSFSSCLIRFFCWLLREWWPELKFISPYDWFRQTSVIIKYYFLQHKLNNKPKITNLLLPVTSKKLILSTSTFVK